MGSFCSGKSGQRPNQNLPERAKDDQAQPQQLVQLQKTQEKPDQNYELLYEEGDLEKQFKEIEEILNTLNKEINRLSTFLQEEAKIDNQLQ
ncbi:hypothetical protein pb186bvf_000197 [Paramecium bursaria]